MPTTYLLDKGIVKRLSEARVRILNGHLLTVEQAEVVALIQALRDSTAMTYLLIETVHTIQRRDPRLAQSLSTWTTSLQKGRYLRRWARRLNAYNFTPEDATLISTASFGLDTERRTFGAEVIVTLDQPMMTNYRRHLSQIQDQFQALRQNLAEPYHRVRLPDLWTPAGVLQQMKVTISL